MEESNILGFSSFTLPIFTDNRGEFRTWFVAQNINIDPGDFVVMQSNISTSVNSVIRGSALAMQCMNKQKLLPVFLVRYETMQ
jgi:dTDP-4-dehydrorhamnose 3,5-epimerase-like enzyme